MNDETKIIYVHEETYRVIVEKLGYQPSNLEIGDAVPRDIGYVMDDSSHVFRGFEGRITAF